MIRQAGIRDVFITHARKYVFQGLLPFFSVRPMNCGIRKGYNISRTIPERSLLAPELAGWITLIRLSPADGLPDVSLISSFICFGSWTCDLYHPDSCFSEEARGGRERVARNDFRSQDLVRIIFCKRQLGTSIFHCLTLTLTFPRDNLSVPVTAFFLL